MTPKMTPEQIKEEIEILIEISIKGLNQAIADGKAFKKIFYNTDFRYDDDPRYSAVSKTVEIIFRNSFTGDMTAVVSAYIGTAVDGVCDYWEFYTYGSYIMIEGFDIPASDIEELLGVPFKDLV